MVEMHIDYAGQLRCEAVHGPSGTRLHTDAPVDNHGRGESFSPTDLLATALAGCVMTIMGIKAQSRSWDMTGARARVVKHMSDDLPRRIVRLELDVTLPASLDEDQAEVLQRVGLQCPVMQSLHPDIVVEHRFQRG
ncbi:MAG: OsmC family protein [Wenzhouxiangellaceae bacterium]